MNAKFSGVLMVTDSSGESIRYCSHAELAAALSSLDSEILRAGGNRPPFLDHFQFKQRTLKNGKERRSKG